MRIWPRIFWASLVAPFAVAPAVFVALPLLYLSSPGNIPSNKEFSELVVEWFGLTIIMAVGGGIIAFFAIVVVGLPIYGILRYFDLARPLPCALLAGAIGLVGGEFAEPDPAFFSLMGICAAAVAATFCRVANGPANRA